jgi:hypothetical protein
MSIPSSAGCGDNRTTALGRVRAFPKHGRIEDIAVDGAKEGQLNGECCREWRRSASKNYRKIIVSANASIRTVPRGKKPNSRGSWPPLATRNTRSLVFIVVHLFQAIRQLHTDAGMLYQCFTPPGASVHVGAIHSLRRRFRRT